MNASDRLVLIDTSVWINYFRGERETCEEVGKLIDAGRVCCLKLIMGELIQGARGEKEIKIIRDLIDVFPLLEESSDSWGKAGILSFQLRKAGKNIGLGDCYIATVAGENDATIYSLDRQFKEVQSYADITLLWEP
jgi:hypothetical protein